ncbi:hypothetical protein llap_5325 [Limosa lapponica baueri]|uniref:Uncharacterized protein n=1 Tax=Limosa lapponica baueri TaxID=1758121 RepID=A0A2I0UE98_LIMLA|nr:hypothetical protein llap_5325 [Limosa lapponica baueri]
MSWRESSQILRAQIEFVKLKTRRKDADAQLTPQQASALLPYDKSEEGAAVSRGGEQQLAFISGEKMVQMNAAPARRVGEYLEWIWSNASKDQQ